MEEKEKTESEASKKVWTAGEVREVEGGSFLHMCYKSCLYACLSVCLSVCMGQPQWFLLRRHMMIVKILIGGND